MLPKCFPRSCSCKTLAAVMQSGTSLSAKIFSTATFSKSAKWKWKKRAHGCSTRKMFHLECLTEIGAKFLLSSVRTHSALCVRFCSDNVDGVSVISFHPERITKSHHLFGLQSCSTFVILLHRTKKTPQLAMCSFTGWLSIELCTDCIIQCVIGQGTH